MTEAAGPTAYAKHNIEDALTAFLCLIDDDMLKHIRDCTIAEAHRVMEDSSWDMTVEGLKAFIALVYIRGTIGENGMDLARFWSSDWCYAFFKETIFQKRFQEIMRFLRFHKKETRCTRLQEGKFTLVAEIWEKFVQNSIAFQPTFVCGAHLGMKWAGKWALCRIVHRLYDGPMPFAHMDFMKDCTCPQVGPS